MTILGGDHSHGLSVLGAQGGGFDYSKIFDLASGVVNVAAGATGKGGAPGGYPPGGYAPPPPPPPSSNTGWIVGGVVGGVAVLGIIGYLVFKK